MLLLGHKVVQNACLLDEVLKVHQKYSPINSERVKCAVEVLFVKKIFADICSFKDNMVLL